MNELSALNQRSAVIPNPADSRLLDTRRAFDSVAADYDGPIGNNALIRRMREAMWRTLTNLFPRGARLLDLGCGTGIDAAYLASRGYQVIAIDWSSEMVARTRARASEAGLSDLISVSTLGLHELGELGGRSFDGIYSDLGPLNCAVDLRAVARDCARLLKSKGTLVASVIGRTCPWEYGYYAAHRDWPRARLRGSNDVVPVGLNRHTVWTKYYAPGEFLRKFKDGFEVAGYRALGLFAPPPYLIRIYERYPRLIAPLLWADDHLGGLPILREAGDHFLMVLTKRD